MISLILFLSWAVAVSAAGTEVWSCLAFTCPNGNHMTSGHTTETILHCGSDSTGTGGFIWAQATAVGVSQCVANTDSITYCNGNAANNCNPTPVTSAEHTPSGCDIQCQSTAFTPQTPDQWTCVTCSSWNPGAYKSVLVDSLGTCAAVANLNGRTTYFTYGLVYEANPALHCDYTYSYDNGGYCIYGATCNNPQTVACGTDGTNSHLSSFSGTTSGITCGSNSDAIYYSTPSTTTTTTTTTTPTTTTTTVASKQTNKHASIQIYSEHI